MALSFTLGSIVTRCQQRANREGDGQLDPTEYKALISEKYGEMHALVTEKGARYFETEVALNLSNLALPANHLSTIGIDFVMSGSTGPRRPLIGPIQTDQRTYLVGLATGGPALYFGLEASSIALYPAPTSGTYKHLYNPQPTDYSASSDSTMIDLITIYGLKFIVWGVTSIAQHKGSEAQDRALAEEAKALAQIEYWACCRAMTYAPRRPPGNSWPPDGGGSLGRPDAGDWRWSR